MDVPRGWRHAMAIIAISRGTLHGGQALAEIVARQLGYPCVSRESIVHSSEWYGIHVDIPSETGTASPSYWEKLAGVRTRRPCWIKIPWIRLRYLVRSLFKASNSRCKCLASSSSRLGTRTTRHRCFSPP